jgi:L-lactate dehydrogenase complex protein LldF
MLYRLFTRTVAFGLKLAARKKGRFTSLPLAGGWTRVRDMPAPQGQTFQALYAKRRSR